MVGIHTDPGREKGRLSLTSLSISQPQALMPNVGQLPCLPSTHIEEERIESTKKLGDAELKGAACLSLLHIAS